MGRGVEPNSPFYGRVLASVFRRGPPTAISHVTSALGSATILAGSEAPAHEAERAPSSPAQASIDKYLSQVAKYVPAEIVAAWLFLSTILKTGSVSSALPWVVFFGLVVFCPFYLYRATKGSPPRLRWDHTILGTIAFGVWVFALGGPFTQFVWYSPTIAVIVLVFYSLGVPLVVDPTVSPDSIIQQSP